MNRGRPRCILALEDGTVFVGRAFGSEGTRSGEAVFNTSLTGYQEVLTDPSYCRQIVTMTAPQIGNYGITPVDDESPHPHVAGFVVRELAGRYSSHRATIGVDEYLQRHGVIGIDGVDTRALTKRLRVHGAMRAVITTEEDDPVRCVALARGAPSMKGADLVSIVAPESASRWTQGIERSPSDIDRSPVADRSHAADEPVLDGSGGSRRVVAVDCGMKRNILRHLVTRTGPVTVVPPTISAAEILDHRPDGVLVSNGPGDPSAVGGTIATLRDLIGRVPIFGICLGHQLLALALGGSSFKLKFGHRGANQPVRNEATGRVEITSQNHGFAIDPDSLRSSGAVVTHTNLNDHTLEGFSHADTPLFAVQYHPEASPGPHDATYLFDCFATMIHTGRPPSPEDMASAQAALASGERGSL